MTWAALVPQLAVFPLKPIVNGACGCGDPKCRDIGKHPDCLWSQIEPGQKWKSPHHPHAGYGIATGERSGVIVVDCDGADAQERFDALGPRPPTLTVRRGPVNRHFYFKWPGFRHKNTASLIEKKVDTRGDGGYVVAPGSPHKSGLVYEIEHDLPVADAPEWLVQWLQKNAQPSAGEAVQPSVGDVTDPAERLRMLEMFVDHCKNAAPAVEGTRDTSLFPVCQRGAWDLRLPTEDVLAVIAEHWNPRCSPPMEAHELARAVRHKCKDAKTNSRIPRAEPPPAGLEHLFAGVTESAPVAAEPAPAPAGLPIIWGRWDEPFLPPPYLLEGLIPSGKVCAFYAEGGSVKTWASLALGIAVATGKPWLGFYGVKRGRTLIVDFEDGREEFKRRKEILAGPGDIPDLGYLYGHMSLVDQNAWQQFADLGLTLIVVDALASGSPIDADENSTEFAAAVKMAGRFTEATGATVLFIHHANKTGGMRGTSAVRDQCDVVFKFEPVEETREMKRMRMVCDKPGPQKKPMPVNLELTDRGLSIFADGGCVTAGASAPADEGTIEDVKRSIRLALDTRGSISSVEGIRSLVGKGKKRVDDAIKEMLKNQEIVDIRPGNGFQLDDDAKRTARVITTLREHGVTYKKAQHLADASHVPRAFIDRLQALGAICQSADKRWIEIQR